MDSTNYVCIYDANSVYTWNDYTSCILTNTLVIVLESN